MTFTPMTETDDTAIEPKSRSIVRISFCRATMSMRVVALIVESELSKTTAMS